MVSTLLLRYKDFMPGDKMGEYTLLERIGLGGEGSVWSAREPQKGDIVVVKLVQKYDSRVTLRGALAYEEQFYDLDHPHIRKLYEVGEYGDYSFICMKYYPTGSLKLLLRDGPLPIPETLQMAAQMTTALNYIHSRNIVHRDLKPTNILLDTLHRTYLTDFGLARPISQTTQALHTGQGTAPYAPPEQHTKAIIHRRSDVYSFGVMLYEMFTGILPWDGNVPLAIKQLESGEEIPDPRELNVDLPKTTVAALRKLTAAEFENRPNSILQAFAMVVRSMRGEPLDGVTIEEGMTLAERALQSLPKIHDEDALVKLETEGLLKEGLAAWLPDNSEFKLNLTNLAYLDQHLSNPEFHDIALNSQHHRFMAHGAITHGVNQMYWWKRLESPEARLQLSEDILSFEGEEAIERVIRLLIKAPELLPHAQEMPVKLGSRLIDVSIEAATAELKEDALQLMLNLAQPQVKWQQVGMTESDDRKLALVAMTEDATLAKMAAKLIGILRSQDAVQLLVDAYGSGESSTALAALVETRRVTGGLPDSVPARTRVQVWLELAFQQLTYAPGKSLQAYAWSALAGALGLGFYVFAMYRVPSLFNNARILNTLGSALLFGPLVGIGIFAARLIAQRLEAMRRILRILTATLIGAPLINLSFASYHILFLDAVPRGWLVLLGSLIMAAGFGLGAGLFNKRLLHMLFGAIFTGAGIYTSWLLSTRILLTPMLYYEQGKPLQNILMICGSAALIGIVSYIANIERPSD